MNRVELAAPPALQVDGRRVEGIGANVILPDPAERSLSVTILPQKPNANLAIQYCEVTPVN